MSLKKKKNNITLDGHHILVYKRKTVTIGQPVLCKSHSYDQHVWQLNLYLMNQLTDITVTTWWVRWRLKSTASRLFTQTFIQAHI